MGAWGTGNFENDDAMDWVAELETSPDTQLLSSAFNAVTSGGIPDSPVACVALAAAEVVAALRGKPDADLPEEVQNWVTGKPEASTGLAESASTAVSRILESSELRQLWEETDDFEEWCKVLTDLKVRLS